MWQALKEIWPNPYARLVVGVLVFVPLAVALYFLFDWTRAVWTSFLVAYLLAYLLNPVAVWFERRRLSRGLGVLAVGLSLLLTLGLLWLLGVRVAAQFSLLAAELPAITAFIEEVPFLVARAVDASFGNTFDQVFISLNDLASTLSEQVRATLEGAREGSGVLQGLGNIFGGGAQVAITLVLTIYLLYNFPRYSRSFLRAFPHRFRPTVEDVMGNAGYAVGGYIRGQLVIALFVGILTTVGLLLIGVPLAIPLGVFTGIANLIPFFGPLIAAVPTVLFGLTVGWPQALGALGVLLLVQQLDANVLTPLVFSQVIDIDPVTIILAVFIGSALFGILGAIVAVPVAVFLTLLYREYYLEGAWYKQPAPKKE